MRESNAKRLLFASIFACAAAAIVAFANPVDRLRADLRADTQGFAVSLEYSAKMLKF